MTKPLPIQGKPTLHFWSRLRDVAFGGTPESQLLGRHPKVREYIRTFFGADSSLNFPNNPGSIVGKTRVEASAQRLRERLADEVARGADPASVAFFIQKFGESSGAAAGTGVDLHRAADDAVGIATLAQRYNAMSCDKAINGPLTDANKIPWATLSAQLRDAFKAELVAAELDPPGLWIGDTETTPEPWHWCRTTGGTWTANVNADFASEEVLFKASHRPTPGYALADGDEPIDTPESADLTLTGWIAEAVARNPGFAPIANQDWASAANIASNSTRDMLRLRTELKNSRYAAISKDIWAADSFWQDLIVVNYEQGLTDNPRFPITTVAQTGGIAGGSGVADHVTTFHGLDGASPVFYPVAWPGDKPRFSAVSRKGPGRGYDEANLFARVRRWMTALVASSTPNARKFPWVKGIETRVGSVPTSTETDLLRIFRACASYPGCLDIVVWQDDVSSPDFAAMLRVVEAFYPEWVRTGDGLDWEAA